MTQMTQATSSCTARCPSTSFLREKLTLSVYDFAILQIQTDLYYVRIPRLVELLCYIRDTTNASTEWVFAEQVKLAGRDFYKSLQNAGSLSPLQGTHRGPPNTSFAIDICGAMHLTDIIGL